MPSTCSYCGSTVDRDWAFCPNCGRREPAPDGPPRDATPVTPSSAAAAGTGRSSPEKGSRRRRGRVVAGVGLLAAVVAVVAWAVLARGGGAGAPRASAVAPTGTDRTPLAAAPSGAAPSGAAPTMMPSFVGTSLSEAMGVLGQHGMTPTVTDTLDESKPDGTVLTPGSSGGRTVPRRGHADGSPSGGDDLPGGCEDGRWFHEPEQHRVGHVERQDLRPQPQHIAVLLLSLIHQLRLRPWAALSAFPGHRRPHRSVRQ